MMTTTDAFSRLPQEVRDLYATQHESGNVQFDKDGWLFLAETEINRRGRLRQHMIPFAIQYGGLGLYRVLEYVPSSQGYFIHIDGGSNDYDRRDHALTWNAYQPRNNEIHSSPLSDIIVQEEQG